MFWNGSHIGSIRERNILKIKKINNVKYYHIDYEGSIFWCMMGSSENRIPCIIDEISHYFNIQKIGTHSCTRLRKNYILYRVDIPPLMKLCDISANERKQLSKTIKRDIRKMILFRHICGANTNYSNIFIKNNSVITAFTNVPTSCDIDNNIPQSLFIEWIEDYIVDIVIDLSNNIDFTDIIERIDEDLVYYSDIVENRLNEIRSLRFMHT